MAIEIEHKYLIDALLWSKIIPDKSFKIKQAYLLSEIEKTIRVRTKDKQGYLTIKGKTINASRPEFEYEIPFEDALELIKTHSSELIEKTRHIVLHEGNTWEVDEFEGLNKGLFVAEIELQTETEIYKLPTWVKENITDELKYANSNLAIHPFTKWNN